LIGIIRQEPCEIELQQELDRAVRSLLCALLGAQRTSTTTLFDDFLAALHSSNSSGGRGGGAADGRRCDDECLQLEVCRRMYSPFSSSVTRANSAIVRVAKKGRTSCVNLQLTFNLNLEPEPVVGNNKVRHRPTAHTSLSIASAIISSKDQTACAADVRAHQASIPPRTCAGGGRHPPPPVPPFPSLHAH
jgi:hypothetical protein